MSCALQARHDQRDKKITVASARQNTSQNSAVVHDILMTLPVEEPSEAEKARASAAETRRARKAELRAEV